VSDPSSEYAALVEIAERSGQDKGAFGSPDVIHVVVHANRIPTPTPCRGYPRGEETESHPGSRSRD
jgi:hypothetical protein